MTAPFELRTARLLLRSVAQEDIPAIVRLAGAKEIAATTLGIPHPYVEEDARKYLAKSKEDFLAGRSVSFAICPLPGSKFCGAVGLVVSAAHRRAELGYWIGVPFWRRGYATEAARAAMQFGFENLQLNRITRITPRETQRQNAFCKKSACAMKAGRVNTSKNGINLSTLKIAESWRRNFVAESPSKPGSQPGSTSAPRAASR